MNKSYSDGYDCGFGEATARADAIERAKDAAIAALTEKLRAVEAERDEMKRKYATQCAGSMSALERRIHLEADLSALRAELARKDAALKAARDWRGDLTALYEKRDAICRGMKDCKHCAKWAGHPISTMCCESGTPNHYGQLSNIDKEIRREEDRCIVPHEVRAIIERALQPKEPPCQTA